MLNLNVKKRIMANMYSNRSIFFIGYFHGNCHKSFDQHQHQQKCRSLIICEMRHLESMISDNTLTYLHDSSLSPVTVRVSRYVIIFYYLRQTHHDKSRRKKTQKRNKKDGKKILRTSSQDRFSFPFASIVKFS